MPNESGYRRGLAVARQEFVRRLRRRDARAWEELFLAWSGKLYAFALHTTGEPTVAQDIVSETFARAYRDIDRFGRSGSAVESWLYTIARHRLADFHRQRSRARLVHLDAASNVAATTDSSAEVTGRDLSAQLRGAIAQLPRDQRAVVLLRFFGMLSGEETAAVLGKSHGAVRQLQLRALRNLRAVLAGM